MDGNGIRVGCLRCSDISGCCIAPCVAMPSRSGKQQRFPSTWWCNCSASWYSSMWLYALACGLRPNLVANLCLVLHWCDYLLVNLWVTQADMHVGDTTNLHSSATVLRSKRYASHVSFEMRCPWCMTPSQHNVCPVLSHGDQLTGVWSRLRR